MRKLIALSAACLMVAGAFGGVATAGKKKAAAHQHVEGTVMIPQGGNGAATCVYRAHRTLYIAAGEQVNGIAGYTFEVDPKTVGLPFKLEASDGTGFDISFYATLGAPTDPGFDPTAAPANIAFEKTGLGGEEGTVPEGYPYAFVCMTDGSNGSFSYAAGK